MKFLNINAYASMLLMILFLMGSFSSVFCECQNIECCLEHKACDNQDSFNLDKNANCGDYDCCSATEGVNSAPQNSHNHDHFFSTYRLLNNATIITSTLFSIPEHFHGFYSFQTTPISQVNCFLYSSKTTSLLI